jgi:cytochrome c-type biogenesis protein CcmE
VSDTPAPDDEPLPEDGLNLTPRSSAPVPGRRRSRRWGPIVVLALVVVAGGVLVTQFLGTALDYYCNADEVGVKAACSGDKSLRVQGTVAPGTLVRMPTETRFIIEFNGRTLPVVYDGEPGGKFDECIPVVVRGRLVNGTFEGNQVEVKHSNEYEEENADRLALADCPAAA